VRQVPTESLLAALKQAGLPIGVDDHLRVGRLVAADLPWTRKRLRTALGAVLARGREQRSLFEKVFDQHLPLGDTPANEALVVDSPERHAAIDELAGDQDAERSVPATTANDQPRRRPWLAVFLLLGAVATGIMVWKLAVSPGPTRGADGGLLAVVEGGASDLGQTDAPVSGVADHRASPEDLVQVDAGDPGGQEVVLPRRPDAAVKADSYLVPDRGHAQKTEAGAAQEPVAKQGTVEPVRPPDEPQGHRVQWLSLSLAGTLLLLLSLYLRRHRGRGKRISHRGPWRYAPSLGVSRLNLYSRSQVEEGARALTRVGRRGDALGLDLEATALATARNAGYPTVVLQRSPPLPTVLVLWDEEPRSANWQRLAARLLDSLEQAGVRLTRFRFARDPRWLHGPQGSMELEDFKGERFDLILVIGEGDGAVDPQHGSAASWARDLEQLRPVLWLNPLPRCRWSHGARSLARRLPMDVFTTAALDAVRAAQEGGRQRYCPRIIFEAPATPEGLFALRAYLGNAAFTWLAACAVSPRPFVAVAHWLGARHVSGWSEEDRLCLLSLPWFQQGRWPEGLREALLRELLGRDAELEQRIRASLREELILEDHPAGSLANLRHHVLRAQIGVEAGEPESLERLTRLHGEMEPSEVETAARDVLPPTSSREVLGTVGQRRVQELGQATTRFGRQFVASLVLGLVLLGGGAVLQWGEEGVELLFGASGRDAPAKTTKVWEGKVPVVMYVMSRCPWSIKALDAFLPVLDEIGDHVNFRLEYIGTVKDGKPTSRRGPTEVEGDIRQLCAREFTPDQNKWAAFAACENKAMRGKPIKWEGCARYAALEVGEMQRCIGGAQGKNLAKASFEVALKAGVWGSPTIVIDGDEFFGQRDKWGYMRAICAAMPQEIPACSNVPSRSLGTKVQATIISDKRCKQCKPRMKEVVGIIEERYFTNLDVTSRLDWSALETRALCKRLGIGRLPVMLFHTGVDKAPGFKQLQGFLTQNGEFWELGGIDIDHDPTAEICDNGVDDTNNGDVDCKDATCKSLCRPERKNEVDCFFEVSNWRRLGYFTYKARELVKKSKGKIMFGIHFIEQAWEGGKPGIQNRMDVVEVGRFRCVQKYKPTDIFLKYMFCRIASPSKSWKHCTWIPGDSPNIVKICKEPDSLFSPNRIAKSLGIGKRTCLVNNRYKVPANIWSITIELCRRNKTHNFCDKLKQSDSSKMSEKLLMKTQASMQKPLLVTHPSGIEATDLHPVRRLLSTVVTDKDQEETQPRDAGTKVNRIISKDLGPTLDAGPREMPPRLPRTLTKAQIKSGVRKIHAKVRRCFNRMDGPGTAQVALTISSSGGAKVKRIQGRDVDWIAKECVGKKVYKFARFPRFKGSPITTFFNVYWAGRSP